MSRPHYLWIIPQIPQITYLWIHRSIYLWLFVDFYNRQYFPSQFHHYLAASLFSVYTSLHTALTSKPVLTCFHSPYIAVFVPNIALTFPRFNSTQLKLSHFFHYFQRQVIMAVEIASISIQSICASKPSQAECNFYEGIPPARKLLGQIF